MSKQRRTFSAEFKREAAALVFGPKLQPYRRLPFAGGGGFGLAPLGEAARGGAPGCDPEEQGVDA